MSQASQRAIPAPLSLPLVPFAKYAASAAAAFRRWQGRSRSDAIVAGLSERQLRDAGIPMRRTADVMTADAALVDRLMQMR